MASPPTATDLSRNLPSPIRKSSRSIKKGPRLSIVVHYPQFDQNLYSNRNQPKHKLSRSGVVVTFSPSKRERWVRFPPATMSFCSLRVECAYFQLIRSTFRRVISSPSLNFFGPPLVVRGFTGGFIRTRMWIYAYVY